MKIAVLGGLGYTGTILTEHLLLEGHKVTVIDKGWFGDKIKNQKSLKKIKIDIRDINKISLKGIKKVIHLANIANDPSVDLNQSLSWEVNALATKLIVEKCIKDKVKHFIFASSGSVYGLKKEKKVTEDLSLEPLSTYNKTKMIAERIIQSYKDEIKYHIIRPATVCGYSPRMRLDVTVNMFVYQAIKKKYIEVHGGRQIRPNIHIKDLTNVYMHFLKNDKLKSGIYNAGFENLSILNIAKRVSKICNCKLKIIKKFNDQRSYRQNSDKLLSTGFRRLHSVDDAIYELSEKLINKTLIPDDTCFTVKYMKKKKFN